MPGSEDAFKIFKNSKYPIGIHLVLSSDNSLSNSKPILNSLKLCDESGSFYSQSDKNFWEIINTFDTYQVYKEITAQLQLFIEKMGKKPTHITSHHHVHGSEKLLPVFLKISKEYNIPLRAPIRKSNLVNIPKANSKWVLTDHFALDYKGNINRASVDNFIKSIEKYDDGIVEIMVHPGYPAVGGDAIFNDWWNKELGVLNDKRVRGFLSKQILINYRDLSRAKLNI